MERNVCLKGQLGPFRDDKVLIVGANGPVQYADQHLEGRPTHGECVLRIVQSGGGSQIGEDAADEGERADGESEDGEILEMPAVGLVNGGMVVLKPFEGVGEGGEADELEAYLATECGKGACTVHGGRGKSPGVGGMSAVGEDVAVPSQRLNLGSSHYLYGRASGNKFSKVFRSKEE